MDIPNYQSIILYIQRTISFLGTFIILSGVLWSLLRFLVGGIGKHERRFDHGTLVNHIRMDLGRVLILGLEFIVAADLISTTITPDYYSLGIVAGIVLIRTVLSFSLNRELASLRREN